MLGRLRSTTGGASLKEAARQHARTRFRAACGMGFAAPEAGDLIQDSSVPRSVTARRLESRRSSDELDAKIAAELLDFGCSKGF